MDDPAEGGARRHKGWQILLIIPFIFTLFPQIYASQTPELFGFPFYYWWQILWVILGGIVCTTVYFITR
ncbi:MAG: DUF3311 domain-containing protein [Chloroflexi bacterium]|nr:DUF3311 domain-containing protein [Chloroflexota bacterium]